MCSRLGVSNYAIQKWVAGVSAPTDENLARLARLSGMDQETIRNAGVVYVED
jgi:transcriptional regulator with XRE-family HTH domain